MKVTNLNTGVSTSHPTPQNVGKVVYNAYCTQRSNKPVYYLTNKKGEIIGKVEKNK